MHLEVYINKYEGQLKASTREYLRGIAGSPYGQHLAHGMLQFTADTAPSLGGPFPGGFGYYDVRDFRQERSRTSKPRGKLVTELHTEYFKKHPKFSQDGPTVEKPIRIKIYGNDDSTWSAFYATQMAAFADLDLFLGTQPLRLYEVIDGFGFVFTN